MLRHKIALLRPFVSEQAISGAVATLNSGWIGCGPRVHELEAKIRTLINNDAFLALNSCTAALHLAYKMAGVGAGDEVITTPITCLATNVPILYRGARPVWSDIKADGTIDSLFVKSLISSKTKAIVAVDFAGRPCDLDELMAVGEEAGIPIIEDAAHALGAQYIGKPIGCHSDFVCFSFQAVKSVTSVDGGGIAFRNRKFLDACRRMRWYGIDRNIRQEGDYNVFEIGYKYEMNDLCASIGLGNLQHMDLLARCRESQALQYTERLQNVSGIRVPPNQDDRKPSHWLYPVLVEQRDNLRKKLADAGVESSPLHYRNDKVKLFREFSCKELPMTDYWENHALCLPIGNWVEIGDIELICELIKSGW